MDIRKAHLNTNYLFKALSNTHSFTCIQAIPAFTPQPQSITALSLALILPSHRG